MRELAEIQKAVAPRGWWRKRDVAMLYFPSANPNVAVGRLRRWILADRELHRELERAGYRPLCRTFSPAQMRVFRKYLS